MQTQLFLETHKVKWYLRLLHWAIDTIAIFLIFVIIALFALLANALGAHAMLNYMDSLSENDFNLIFILLMIIYYAVTEGVFQRSVGKFLTGTIVVDKNGLKPAIGAIIGRSLCRIISLEALSFLSATPRGWHDSASGTYVVNRVKLNEALTLRQSLEEIGTSSE